MGKKHKNRKQNKAPLQGEPLLVMVPDRLYRLLERLHETGLYGSGPTDTALRLIEQGLEQAIQNELIEKLV